MWQWIFKNSSYSAVTWALVLKLLSCECHRTQLISSQHWLRLRLGTDRHPDLFRHVASPGNKELKCLPIGTICDRIPAKRPRWIPSFLVYKVQPARPSSMYISYRTQNLSSLCMHMAGHLRVIDHQQAWCRMCRMKSLDIVISTSLWRHNGCDLK